MFASLDPNECPLYLPVRDPREMKTMKPLIEENDGDMGDGDTNRLWLQTFFSKVFDMIEHLDLTDLTTNRIN